MIGHANEVNQDNQTIKKTNIELPVHEVTKRKYYIYIESILTYSPIYSFTGI